MKVTKETRCPDCGGNRFWVQCTEYNLAIDGEYSGECGDGDGPTGKIICANSECRWESD